MQLFADWHVHTHYSDGHATPEEMVAAAVRRGLTEVAITDHGPRGMFIGVRNAGVYREIKEQAARLSELYPVRVLVGAEANVISLRGEIDVPEAVINELDILIAGLHPQVWCRPWWETLTWILPNRIGKTIRWVREKMREANTMALVAAVRNNPLTFISHPDLVMDVDLDEVARACAAAGCAMEINTGHHYNRDNVVQAALRWGAKLVVNSDAHFPSTVGELSTGIQLLDKYRVPPEKVLNARPVEPKSGSGYLPGAAGLPGRLVPPVS
ncbi:PHP domain-containing protein [Desulfoscipio gibsoniae]|uniref:PHP family phosphohydrolase, histidinol phosphatase n=1 Tax=Desulfoscipio gibsoniae DSM 7213 TaxID=767817 RepID=R4KSK1_9FIRM|nr:PHP domain-containing protein [Desulfoscipio gibsoniae]AGL03550.1 PHP family phosphohydrolase, histidinol phosphatase [Desulfoscipio gibsoniae DSM 7213]